MTGRSILLFMFGYQEAFRIQVQSLACSVLKKLGADVDAEILLVGALRPGLKNNQVCIEPEDGKWTLPIFDGLLADIENRYQNHEMQSLYFGDEPSMRDKPEWIRRDSVTTAVAESLRAYDALHNVSSFCGSSRVIGDYYVTPVLQLQNSIFDQFPPLKKKPSKNKHRGSGYLSLIHAAIYGVLQAATDELERPEPGRFIYGNMRDADEIIRNAAHNFLHTPGLLIDPQYIHNDLFSTLNLVSSLMYEGIRGLGQLTLVDPDNDCVDFLLRLSTPVPLGEPRWVRKVLQMATTGIGILATSNSIVGLGGLKESHDPEAQDAFTVTFLDHYLWELRCGDRALLRSHYGIPKLPQEPFDNQAFIANYLRIFPQATHDDALHLWALLLAQIHLEHGSMIVVAEDASSEAERLHKQGTQIVPTHLSESLLRSVSGIDGTILLDPYGYCHAIGIILDGEASDQCAPARGSRYNSGVRYVQKQQHRRLAIVASVDRTIDLIPPLRRLVSRSLIERHISALEMATNDNCHVPRNWLDRHRFYLNSDQCNRVNVALENLNAMPKEPMQIYWQVESFIEHPDMEESYLIF